MEDKKITIRVSDIHRYIADVLNEEHHDYPKFVRGIKEFIAWAQQNSYVPHNKCYCLCHRPGEEGLHGLGVICPCLKHPIEE